MTHWRSHPLTKFVDNVQACFFFFFKATVALWSRSWTPTIVGLCFHVCKFVQESETMWKWQEIHRYQKFSPKWGATRECRGVVMAAASHHVAPPLHICSQNKSTTINIFTTLNLPLTCFLNREYRTHTHTHTKLIGQSIEKCIGVKVLFLRKICKKKKSNMFLSQTKKYVTLKLFNFWGNYNSFSVTCANVME